MWQDSLRGIPAARPVRLAMQVTALTLMTNEIKHVVLGMVQAMMIRTPFLFGAMWS